MSNYKRMVAYLYNYENQIKHNNVGYARIELQNDMCKIMVNLKVLSVNKGKLKVYIYTRDEGAIKGIYLGDIDLKSGSGEFRITTRADSIMGTGYDFDSMGGIIVYDSVEKYFGTEWDDMPIIFDEIHEIQNIQAEENAGFNDIKSQIGNTRNENSSSINLETINNIYKMYREIQNGSNILQESNNENENIKVAEDNSTELEEDIINISSDFEEGSEIKEENIEQIYSINTSEDKNEYKYNSKEEEELINTSSIAATREEYVAKGEIENLDTEKKTREKFIKDIIKKKNEERPFIVRKIFSNYPRMYPFSGGEVVDCVRVDPQDIGMLPMELWVLGNNSFLLHGYYSYRHLIFAALKEDEEEKYILGVPGINENRERFMANMFGFENFKGIKTEESNGDFGYWYKILNL